MRPPGAALDSWARRTARLICGKIARTDCSLLRRCVRLDPILPAGDIVLLCLGKTVAQTADGVLRRCSRVLAKAKRQYKGSLRLQQIDLPDQRHIAVLGPCVFPGHLLVRLQIAASRRRSRRSRPSASIHGAEQASARALPFALRQQQRCALDFVHPGGIAATLISEVGRKQDMKPIIGQRSLLRDKPDLLQHRVTMRIGQDLLFDAVATVAAGIDHCKRRHAVGQPVHFGCRRRASPRRRTSLHR